MYISESCESFLWDITYERSILWVLQKLYQILILITTI
jgi:hypothetical protein